MDKRERTAAEVYVATATADMGDGHEAAIAIIQQALDEAEKRVVDEIVEWLRRTGDEDYAIAADAIQEKWGK